VEVDRSAPVIVEKSVDIDAPPDAVWDVLVDVDAWPTWNSTVGSASLDGAFAPGSRFKWKSGPSTITSTIERADRPEVAGWTGTTLGARATHVWELEAVGEGTRVTTRESMSGLVPRLFSGSMRRKLETSLDTWLREMAGAATRRGR
jgi:uncharacterized protein YndB with AHSA1/START domain